MESIINEQSVKIFSKKLYEVLNYIVPGIFTLEIFFNKGLFSSPPNTIFEFVLFVIWSFILSLPFNLIELFSTDRILEKAKTEIEKSGNEYEINNSSNDHEENKRIVNSMAQFFSINIYLLFLFFINKYLVSHYIYYSFWGINKTILIYLNTLLFFPICFLILFFIARKIENFYVKKVIEELQS
ncbi:hypothetical protein [Flavobacterium sp.]|uniref:hypothetical protein n=1 Tax=Flavobacterium sp. TaxID=239 RepID=UPI00261CF536|nr:hypothetical protein [Flavobacterium sp.]